jgi:type II secretory ATPase GspE/PulE/Tfp pilus assembly ATPase PilB-like protein
MSLQTLIDAQRADDPNFAVTIVDAVLAASAEAGASDVHLTPAADSLDVAWRIDGVLQPLARIPKPLAANVVTRLKVLARLLTYQTAVPQEGRITTDANAQRNGAVEVRISTFPTVFGEKVVARNLPHGQGDLQRLADLGLPADVHAALAAALGQTSGAVIIVGPAGSGKTTTAYACLREILHASAGQRSIASLEDPVEVVVPGVAQSQVNEAAGFDLVAGVRSLVRQDPEVIFIGEIRDPQTAAVAFQAALTGQLVVTTFHASDAAVALSRLADMGVPPYVLRSGASALVAQRLVRRLCQCAAERPATPLDAALGVLAPTVREPRGCDACRRTGYAGRLAVAELLRLDPPAIGQAVLDRRDADATRALAVAAGMQTLPARAAELVAAGVTSPAEVIRVFGLSLPAEKNGA